jgi:hypothetical protein
VFTRRIASEICFPFDFKELKNDYPRFPVRVLWASHEIWQQHLRQLPC